MPTAAKLIGAFCLSVTGLLVAYFFIIENPSYYVTYVFYVGSVLVGFIVGWNTLAHTRTQSYGAAIMEGFKALPFYVVAASLSFAVVDVMRKIDRNQFRDPTDLPLYWIEKAYEHTVTGLVPTVIASLFIGCAVSGICSYAARLRWP